MAIKTAHQPIKVLFEQNETFEVPKYQREYAWDIDAIDDFIDDIKKCLDVRFSGTKRHHFFGGVVTLRLDVPGSSRANYEVIDGQQRLASFVMLAALIVSKMKDLLSKIKREGKTSENKKAISFLEETITTITNLYLVHKYNVELEYKTDPKLVLSQVDNDLFQRITTGKAATSKRPSHDRILGAWNRIETFLDGELEKEDTLAKKVTRLQPLISNVLAEDCTVIFMWSDMRGEAYRIFQVLNDRGVHLTNGDLLKARTLEMLDHDSVRQTQDKMFETWGAILAYEPADIDNYLYWYFSSYEGYRPKTSELTDEFMNARFRSDKVSNPIKSAEATAILEEVEQLNDGFALIARLSEGNWPYPDVSNVKQWDRERLRMLVTHLKHTNAMPLLMALQELPPAKFAEAVAALERFVFRYKTIGNAHISPATKLYLEHAKKIRASGSYKVSSLRKDLAELVEKYVPDRVFSAGIRERTYSPRSGNTQIRYLLITIEDYLKWYEQGAQGQPKCKDKARVFDFDNTTLEHIYPQKVDGAKKESALEPVKQSIGNLTILGPDDNDAAGNKTFLEKKDVLKKSNLQINKQIGERSTWNKKAVNERTDQIAEIAVKVFVP